MPDFASLSALVSEVGPVAAVATVLLWVQARQSSKMLDGLLGGLENVREAQAEGAAKQAEAVTELKGIRRSLDRAETDLRVLAERSAEHGEALRAHGQQLAEHGRRLARLEDDNRRP